MSLLPDLIEMTSDQTTSIEAALLRTKVLAARLQHEGLAEWARREIEGYEPDAGLPPYRIVECRMRGRFQYMIPGSLVERTLDVPMSALPATMQESVTTKEVRQGVVSLVDAARASVDPHVPCPPEVTGLVGQRAYANANCIEAWVEISRACIQNLLSQIRSRLLDFLLDLESRLSDSAAFDQRRDVPALPKPTVHNLFETHIYEHRGSVTIGLEGSSEGANESPDASASDPA